MDINKIMEMCVKRNASDIHLVVGKPPLLRIDNALEKIEEGVLRPEDIVAFMKAITPPEYQKGIAEKGGTEFGFSFEKLGRFRVSVYRERNNLGIALRLIPYKIMTFEEIGLSPQIKEFLYRSRGLILITGPTGSGKTTTLAAMIDHINKEKDCHILTIEDPIEYYHEHKKSIVTQREVGTDVPSFSEAVIRGLRQDPDVVLIGEMRDLATMQAALTAAETGHLVFATLHTTGAGQTIDRLIDAFPTHQQEQVRVQLSLNVIAIISQLLLVKAVRPGRIATFEIMVATPAIQNLIRENKAFRITSEIQTGAKYGMKSMDSSLLELYNRKLITYEDLISKAFDPQHILTELESGEGRKGKKRKP